MTPTPSTEQALREALTDTLDFLERHSNRWDGVNGKHPFTVVDFSGCVAVRFKG